jgi:hypothetical protein
MNVQSERIKLFIDSIFRNRRKVVQWLRAHPEAVIDGITLREFIHKHYKGATIEQYTNQVRA